ncbi:MAG: sialate O-acetylesterase [Massilibacteroides sp.]|nr:sialate O-acetylesterase [Massilibacteroides sp.]
MKIMKLKLIFLAVLGMLGVVPLKALVKLPDILNDNMVIQRNSTVKLWGTTDPTKEVTINATWNAKAVTTKADREGRFSVEVPTGDAGGPYRVLFDDGQYVEIKNVLLGDVWICSGQSNMEYPMKGFTGQPDCDGQRYIVKAKAHTPIRMFTVQRQFSTEKQENCVGTWKQNTSEAVADFSAVGYFFGFNLQEILGVPIGLINTSWGGSSIESWMDKEHLKGFVKDFSSIPTDQNQINAPNKTPMVLYNGMMNPLRKLTVKGFIWYQGEANRFTYTTYEALQASFVSQLRTLFHNPSLPYYFAQIAPFSGNKGHRLGACLREQQLKSSQHLAHAGMATLTDIGEEHRIHPRYKHEVGNRLAYWALADTYGKTGFDYRSPEYEQMRREGDKAILSFRYAENGISTPTGKLSLFEVAGADKVFYPALANIAKNRKEVEVSSDKVSKPVAVRYAFYDFVKGELFGNSGLPVSSFRTDDWTLIE